MRNEDILYIDRINGRWECFFYSDGRKHYWGFFYDLQEMERKIRRRGWDRVVYI